MADTQVNLLKSLQLSESQWQAAHRAVRQRRLRVTVGDVAQETAMSLADAEKALRAMASTYQGSVDVSEDGHILYHFVNGLRDPSKPSFGQRLAKALRIALEWTYKALLAFVMIAYGIFFAIVLIGILVAASANNRNGGGRAGGEAVGKILELLLLSLSFGTYRGRGRRRRQPKDPNERSFFMDVFHLVFGEPDPNDTRDERVRAALTDYVVSQRGLATAEELSPVLGGNLEEAQSRMTPHLLRLNGSPRVSPNGSIIYDFEELVTSAGSRSAARGRLGDLPLLTYEEIPWYTAKDKRKVQIFGLNTFNFVMSIVTFVMVTSLSPVGAFFAAVLPFVLALSIYIVPFVRRIGLSARNRRYRQANLRLAWHRALLQAAPGPVGIPELAQQLATQTPVAGATAILTRWSHELEVQGWLTRDDNDPNRLNLSRLGELKQDVSEARRQRDLNALTIAEDRIVYRSAEA